MNPPLHSRPFPGPVGRAFPGALLLAACAWWAAGRPALQESLAPWADGICGAPSAATLAAGQSPGAAARPATQVKVLSCEPLADVPGKSMVAALVVFPPDAFTPAHRHPGAVQAFVVKGVVRSQLAGGSAQDYGPGQTWFEPPGTLHLFAENASRTDTAEVLATYVVDTGCGALVIPEPAAAPGRT